MSQTVNLAQTSGTSPPASDNLAKRIVDFLEQHPSGVSEAQILDAVEGRRQRKIAVIRALVTAGTVIRTGRGGKGDPFRYALETQIPITAGATNEAPYFDVNAERSYPSPPTGEQNDQAPRLSEEDLQNVVAALQILIKFRDQHRTKTVQQDKSNPISVEKADQVK